MKLAFQFGKIIKYNSEKGFGFISSAGEDIFFHISDYPVTEGEPQVDDKVKFVIVENEGKAKASRIERLDPNPANTKKAQINAHNNSIASSLLSGLRR